MKNALPQFPNFEKLNLAHKDLLQALANDFPSSDFNFAGLFTWDIDELVMVSSLNENLIIRTSDYLTHEVFYSFIGDNEVDKTIKTLTDYAKKRGEQTKLKLILESTKNKATSNLHLVTEDRDNFDYILSINELAKLEGAKYQTMRKRRNRFTRLYGESATEKELDLSSDAVISDINELLNVWKTSRGKQEDEVRDEFKAIEKALEHHDALGIKAFGVYHQNKMIAFTLYEILPNKIAIGHFEKADVNYEGVFVHLKHTFAKHLASLGVETINIEQDLGDEGIRKSKELDHPIEYIKKYTVERIK